MDAVHVKDLQIFCPGYKDRNNSWAKIHFNLLNCNPEFELLPEWAKWRLVHFIILEIQMQKPVPLDISYLKRKGFNLDENGIPLTLQLLHGFLELVTENDFAVTLFENACNVEEKEIREDKIRGEGKNLWQNAQSHLALVGFEESLQKYIPYDTHADMADHIAIRKIFVKHYNLAMNNGGWKTRQKRLLDIAKTSKNKKTPISYFISEVQRQLESSHA